LNVGQDQAGGPFLRQRECFLVGARDAEHAMAETLDQRLQIHRDEGLVLDDQHVGRDLGCKFAARFLDQRAQRRDVHVENLAASSSEKPSSATSRNGLPRLRRQAREAGVGRHVVGHGRALGIQPDRAPDLGNSR
jgi:hypothetical protein